MITRFYIDNFKSLVDFDLELAKFNCLIGLNGAGKSTILQAIDFISAMISGDVDFWLKKRNWSEKNLNSTLTRRSNIKIEVDIFLNSVSYRWIANFNRNKLHTTSESLKCLKTNALLYAIGDGHYFLPHKSMPHPMPIPFAYQGSFLSQIREEWLTKEIIAIKKRLSALRSLDMLSPYSLRQKSRKSDKDDIGMGGEQLSAFIHQLNIFDLDILVRKLRVYYPQIKSIRTKALRSGWIQLEVVETYGEGQITTEAKHINDGLLRTLALLAEQYSPLKTLLFDEIENGINPEVTEKVVDALVSSPKQIIVTTHSPMILNYMSDEVAKESVNLIYKGENGQTHAARFFKVPSVAKKLESLPPGSAMLDVYLQDAAREAEEQRQTKSQDK